MAMRREVAGILGLTMALALAACGDGTPPEEPARPVLVMRPADAAPAGWSAFAGEVRAREESPLSFRVAGQLVRRHVDAGDAVRRGQVLAELDPGDLRLQAQAAQAQLAAAEAELSRARADRARYAALAEQQLVSRSALDAQNAAYAAAEGQARAARAQLDVARNQAGYAELRAPRDGVIASRSAEAGQTLAAGQPVFILAGATGREIAIALPESRIREFAVGQPTQIELWSAPGQRLRGRIREIAAAADAQARTYAARVELDPADARSVELGQSARVYLQARNGGDALRVPMPALQRANGKGTAVWVVDPANGRVRLVPVRVGPLTEDGVPVLGGLPRDAWIVAAGGHLLREGQRVAPVDRQNRPVQLTSNKPAAEQPR